MDKKEENWGGTPIQEETWGGKPLDQTEAPKKEETSTLGALGTGVMRGLTFDFWDELKAAMMAGPAGPEAEKKYEELVKKYRQEQKASEEAHPIASFVGQAAGSLPYMAIPGVGTAREATLTGQIGKQALAGGMLGGLSGAGAGKDTESRLTGAGIGAGLGATVGAASPVVSKAASAIYDRTLKPVFDVAKGYFRPEQMATQTVAKTLMDDQALIETGKIKGLTLRDWQAAKAAGEPVTLADLGGPNTQNFIKKVSETSPEAYAQLENTFETRFRNQAERIAADVRKLTGNEANASKTSEQLRETYDTFRNKDYRNAFTQPNAQFLWDENLQQMSKSPSVKEAMRGAFVDAKEHAAKFELPVPETYNLQFWDNVKKQLDKINTNDSRYWAEKLRNHLDTLVPEYKQARGFAASYFKADDALEAGRKLAGKKIETAELKKILDNMIPEEQDLFREGYASDLSERIIKNMPETKDLSKAIYSTPGEKERINAIFGLEGAKKLELRMVLESIMEASRKSLGSSTKAAEAIKNSLMTGTIGGLIGGYYGGWRPESIIAGATLPSAGKKIALAGAQKLKGKVNAELASKIADLLTSNNPENYKQAEELILKNNHTWNVVKDLANKSITAMGVASVPETPEKSSGGSVTDRMHMAKGGYTRWTPNDKIWNSLNSYQKAAVMSLMEADSANPEDAKNILGAMVNRATRSKEDLGTHVSKAIYQPTFEKSQQKRLPKLLEHPALPELTKWVERRSQGLEPDIVGGATHYLAHEPVMVALQKKQPSKYKSWVNWTQYDPKTQTYGNVTMRDKSHAFLAPEGKYSAPYHSEQAALPLAMIADRDRQPVATATPAPQPTEADRIKLAQMAEEASKPEPIQNPKLTPEDEAKFLQAIQGFMKGQEQLPPAPPPLAAPQAPRPDIPIVRPYGRQEGGRLPDLPGGSVEDYLYNLEMEQGSPIQGSISRNQADISGSLVGSLGPLSGNIGGYAFKSGPVKGGGLSNVSIQYNPDEDTTFGGEYYKEGDQGFGVMGRGSIRYAKGGSVTDKMKLAQACWKGYKAVGVKTKKGKTVPNCVPVKKKKNG